MSQAAPSPSYVALIGDMVGSRALDDRAAVQRRLEQLLEGLNERHADALAARLVITAGDEFQGLLHEPGPALAIARAIQETMHPQRFRVGLGRGPLTTDRKPDAVGMDGPCFHRARSALTARRATGRPGVWVRGFGASLDENVNAIASLVAAVRSDWTTRQVEFVRALRERATQRAVAEHFAVSPSVVSESLAAAKFRELEEAEAAIARLLAAAPAPATTGRAHGGQP